MVESNVTTTNIDEQIAQVLEEFPFLSYGRMLETDYIGIIGNSDNQLLSMYIYTMIPTQELRQSFLTCGSDWWWGSNRQIPINIFIGSQRFRPYREYLKHFARKDFDLIAGPAVSLQETIARRVRKRQVTLVRRTD